MIQIGKFQKLPVTNLVSFGVYMDAGTENPADNILLPGNQVPDNVKSGDVLNVFIYRDSEDRLIATRRTPLAQLGDLAYLKVVQDTNIGAFLDWGLEKDLLLPFSEQKFRVQVGRRYLVAVCLDKKARLCATTHIENYLLTDSPYQKNDLVTGTAYMVKQEFGALVAVDNQYAGFIPENEYFYPIRFGDQLRKLRVIRVREDGRLDLSPRQLAHKQMQDDAEIILEVMNARGGVLPLNDKSHPGAIRRHLHISKKAFKRAVGRLLKTGKVEQTELGLRLK